MDVIINNDRLTVTISELGAEMCSLRDDSGTEYLWNGDPKYWTGRAPNLFPYIGRLTNETYTLFGKPYHMGIHGFASHKSFELESSSGDSAVFVLTDDDETRVTYPFRFEFRVYYRLFGARLEICYSVSNKDSREMYFGVGGHPGFMLPLEDGLVFEDYCLEFDEYCVPELMELSERIFITGKSRQYPLINGRVLELSHGLFDNDALILKDVSRSVTLKSPKGSKGLRVTYPDMPYLGIWHMPATKAPYVCLEPWSSLPSRDGVIEEITIQRDLIALPVGKTYINNWSIELKNIACG